MNNLFGIFTCSKYDWYFLYHAKDIFFVLTLCLGPQVVFLEGCWNILASL